MNINEKLALIFPLQTCNVGPTLICNYWPNINVKLVYVCPRLVVNPTIHIQKFLKWENNEAENYFYIKMQIGVTGQYIFTYLANNIPTNIMNKGSTL